MKQQVDIGVIYSRSGGYELMSNACRSGALAAIFNINNDPRRDIKLRAVERDPEGNVDRYASMCEDILRTSSARHVVGCITSWSRKEVIPVLEKLGATLWYACPYEGFEANDRVVYTHACPNQHLVPLLNWVMQRKGIDGYLIGSNYIWGWEMNRVAREIIADSGGKTLGERYLPLGDTDVSRMIAEIRATRPSFVLNNLIGPSSYAFLAAYARLAKDDPYFAPESCPVLSCNLTECELPVLNGVADNHLAVGPFFRKPAQDLGWPKAGEHACSSSYEASAYMSVCVLADVLSGASGSDNLDLPVAFTDRTFHTPCGPVKIDPRTYHATLPVIIAKVSGHDFEMLDASLAVAPDPYLSRHDQHAVFKRPNLRVVS